MAPPPSSPTALLCRALWQLSLRRNSIPGIACVLAQVLLSTHSVPLLPWPSGALSSLSRAMPLGTSCSVCGRQGSRRAAPRAVPAGLH